MATDWGGLKQATGVALWSAGSVFLESLFWVFLHLISKVAGLVQAGVENFILVARGSGAVHEQCPEPSNCNCREHFTKLEPGYDFVSPPIYGYGPVSSERPDVKVSNRFSVPITEAAQQGLRTSTGTPSVSFVKLETTRSRFHGRDPVEEGSGSQAERCGALETKVEENLPQFHADDFIEVRVGTLDRKYNCNVLDANCRSDIPHFLCNFLGHTRKKWYAVGKGRKIGIFKCWEAAEEQVKGFSGHKQHSFKAHADAEEWFRFKLLALK